MQPRVMASSEMISMTDQTSIFVLTLADFGDDTVPLPNQAAAEVGYHF